VCQRKNAAARQAYARTAAASCFMTVTAAGNDRLMDMYVMFVRLTILTALNIFVKSFSMIPLPSFNDP